MEKGKQEARSGKALVRSAIAVFAGLVLWSIFSETLMPLYRAGKTTELLLNLAGIPVILFGTVVFVYGGFVFVRDTFRAIALPEVAANRVQMDNDPSGRAEASRRNLGILFRAWKPGLIRLGLGFLVIAIGSVIINGLKIFGQSQHF